MDASRIVRVYATVALDIRQRGGRPLDATATEFAELFSEHIGPEDSPLWGDYGVTVAEVHRIGTGGDLPTWDGYNGPYFIDRQSMPAREEHDERKQSKPRY